MGWMKYLLICPKLAGLGTLLIWSLICPLIPLAILAYWQRGKLIYWLKSDGISWPDEAVVEKTETHVVKSYYQRGF